MSAPWLQIEFVKDLYIYICKDTTDQVKKEGPEWLLNIIKKSPVKQIVLRNARLGHQSAAKLSKQLELLKYDEQPQVVDLFENSVKDIGFIQLIRYAENAVAQGKCSLQKINVGCNDIYLEGALSLAQALDNREDRKNPLMIEVIELGNPNGMHFIKAKGNQNHLNKINSQGAREIAKALQQNKYLKYLGLGGCSIVDPLRQDDIVLTMNTFGQMLAMNYILEGLDISNNQLQNSGATSIFKGLSQNKGLKYLFLDCNQISYGAIPLLMALLTQNSCVLENLSLNDNPIGPQGAKSLAFGLSQNMSLRNISLESCQLGDEGIGIICEILSKPLTKDGFDDVLCGVTGVSEHFDQSNQVFEQLHQKVQNDCAQTTAERQIIVKSHTGETIVQISLNSNEKNKLKSVHDSNAQQSENLDPEKQTMMSNIESINVGLNNGSYKMMKYICKVLNSPLHIKYLNLKGNHLNFEGGKQLADALICNQYNLTAVLQFPFEKHEIQNLGAVVQYLENINLSSTGINDDAFIMLCFVFSYLPKLKIVNFCNNYIGEKGGEIGQTFILKSKSLTQFQLQNNQVAHSTINSINKLLQDNDTANKQSGPLLIKEQNEKLEQELINFDLVEEELHFQQVSNTQYLSYVDAINNDDIEHFGTAGTLTKIIEITQLNIKRTEEQLKYHTQAIQQFQQKIKEQEAEIQQKKLNNQKLIEEEIKNSQQLEQVTKQKEEEYNKMKGGKDQRIQENTTLLEQIKKETQKVCETQKIVEKIINQLRDKGYGEVVKRVTSSPNIQQLIYQMEYDTIVKIVPRMASVAGGTPTIPEQSGYDANTVAKLFQDQRAKVEKDPKKGKK